MIIDDALGSGATMNEIALKIHNKFSPKAIFGYAVIGSYKGFDKPVSVTICSRLLKYESHFMKTGLQRQTHSFIIK